MLSMNLRVGDSYELSSSLDMEELSMELTPPLSHTEGAFAVSQWGVWTSLTPRWSIPDSYFSPDILAQEVFIKCLQCSRQEEYFPIIVLVLFPFMLYNIYPAGYPSGFTF